MNMELKHCIALYAVMGHKVRLSSILVRPGIYSRGEGLIVGPYILEISTFITCSKRVLGKKKEMINIFAFVPPSFESLPP